MKRGDTVADFELPDQTGTLRTLTSLLADGPIVLFFYPAAMTPGCTKEACHFRDLAGEFAAVGANRVGISATRLKSRPSSPTRSASTIPCCPTPMARSPRVRRQARAAGQVAPGQAHDVRHRHRSHGARRDLQRGQHGHPRRQGVADVTGTQLTHAAEPGRRVRRIHHRAAVGLRRDGRSTWPNGRAARRDPQGATRHPDHGPRVPAAIQPRSGRRRGAVASPHRRHPRARRVRGSLWPSMDYVEETDAAELLRSRYPPACRKRRRSRS